VSIIKQNREDNQITSLTLYYVLNRDTACHSTYLITPLLFIQVTYLQSAARDLMTAKKEKEKDKEKDDEGDNKNDDDADAEKEVEKEEDEEEEEVEAEAAFENGVEGKKKQILSSLFHFLSID
jgi:hypothetical protein